MKELKKILAIIAVCSYLALSSGIVICLHYCMNRLDSVAIGTSSSNECGKCGMHKDGGCCKDEVMVVKLETSHIATPGISADFSVPATQMQNAGLMLTSIRNFNIAPKYLFAHSPPLNEQDTYLTNRVFRI